MVNKRYLWHNIHNGTIPLSITCCIDNTPDYITVFTLIHNGLYLLCMCIFLVHICTLCNITKRGTNFGDYNWNWFGVILCLYLFEIRMFYYCSYVLYLNVCDVLWNWNGCNFSPFDLFVLRISVRNTSGKNFFYFLFNHFGPFVAFVFPSRS